jgi:hypothetical protein
MAGLYFLKKVFPNFIKVSFRRQVPDARCNIIHAGDEIYDAFQVGLEQYEVGLDGAFYKVLKRSCARDLYERTLDKQRIVTLDEDKLLSEISESSRIESKIVEKNNWTEIERAIIADNNFSFPAWIGKNRKRRVTSYTIENMLQKITQISPATSVEDLKSILEILSEEQKTIEEKLMPNLRQILEH